MLTMMRSWQPRMLINDRGTGEFADFVTPEQGLPSPIPDGPWETCMTISEGNGFWYKGPNAQYKSTATLLHILANIVSKGGNLLLNVGPKPDGTWTTEESSRLAEIGQWLDHNGDADLRLRRKAVNDRSGLGPGHAKRVAALCDRFREQSTTLHLATDQKITAAHLLDGGRSIAFEKSADGTGVDLHYAMPPDTGLPIVIVLDTAPKHS